MRKLRRRRARTKPTRELLEFERAILTKCYERSVPRTEVIPDEIVDEVVRELYGEWTDQARGFVRIIEEWVTA